MEITKEVVLGLLTASHYLEGELIGPYIEIPLYEELPRYRASESLALISVEHAASLRFLMAHANCNTSAFSLFRLQYEALVKSLWALYVASDQHIDLIVGELSEERANRNNKELPSISTMLKQLDDKGTPIADTVKHLIIFKNISWKALNSFVHSGTHAVRRNITGYPPELLFSVIKQSNNLMYIAANTLIVLSGKKTLLDCVKVTQNKFKDCFQLDN